MRKSYLPLTGEKEGMGNIDLYYFTGTGNTLYIAKQLKKRLPEIRLIPVVSLLAVKSPIRPQSKTVGFCFPNHAGHLPIPMSMFMKKLHLTGDEYLFAVCNSAFSKSFSPGDIDRIIRKKRGRLSAYFNLSMPDNHSLVARDYRPPSREEFKRCEDRAQAKLNHIKEIIISKGMHMEKDDRPAPFPLWVDKVLRPLIFHLVEKHPATVLKDALYADSKCNGCSLCEMICPAYRIAVQDGMPVFNYRKTCFGCYGCINFCPEEALQVGSKWFNGKSHTPENSRYPHPYASANEIARQKSRKIVLYGVKGRP